ncbi:hypothetical protein DM058_34820, partial [Klebsiella pneumoniae]
MATISEQPVWEDDVYLIARGDRVEGGRDGVANRQASQLSNRTAFLREQIKSLIDDGVMFSRDYRKEIITLTRHGQAIIKDDFLYYLRDSAPLPYVTTGTTDASWAVDSPFFTSVSDPNLRKNLGSEGGSQLIFGLGNIIGTTSQILSSTDTPDAYQSNGFYAQNDGGEGVWRFTGKTAPARAGTHVITQGKVYNAKGNEYALEICRGSIIVLANGAKAYTYDECTDQTTDDFVCLGQASNGILSRLTLGVSTGNNVATYDGGARLDLIYPTNMYRIGKEP